MLKKICLQAIAFYQSYISPFIGTHCRYYPSCSEYAKQVFLFQNPFVATFKTAGRILTCNQFFKGGIAYPSAFLHLEVRTYKPCLVLYWFIPSVTQRLENIPSGIVMQSQIFYIIKNYPKVSRVR